MRSTTAKSRNPVQGVASLPERRASRRGGRGGATGRGGKAFYQPEFKVRTADLLDADFVPGYN
jgi:hypothetical protein